jgi:signal transduction histidine kinase
VQIGDPRRIKRSSRHLRALIDDILNVAKVEAGQLTIALARCRLRSRG